MVTRMIVSLIDDLDGSAAQETVRFSIDGVGYEIDLSAENLDRLRATLAPFVEHGRRSGRAKAGTGRPPVETVKDATSGTLARGYVTRDPVAAPRRAKKGHRDPALLHEIRSWAWAQGMTLSDRGRIPADVEQAYAAAHPGVSRQMR